MTKSVQLMPQRILAEVRLPDFKDRPKKQADILLTAESLFMQFGYNKVTVEEICREANVSKVTFYKYFKNKFALLEDYLTERLNYGMKTFDRIRMADAGLQEKMQALIAMKESAIGKFSPVFLTSVSTDDPEVMELMSRWTQMGQDALRAFFMDAQAKGQIHRDYKVDFLLHVWMVLGTDARSEEIQKLYGDDYVKLSRDFMNFLCYGTSGPPDET